MTQGLYKKVLIGLLGSRLDRGSGRARWESWRPTVDLFRHEDLLWHRLELLHDAAHERLAREVSEDIRRLSPETEIQLHPLPWRDPWDFEEMYASLHTFAVSYRFDLEDEDYFLHITTGTHVAQICCFLLAESRHVPARLLQSAPPSGRRRGKPGKYTIIDLDLSRYDRLANRFAEEQRQGLSFLKSGIETQNRSFNRQIVQIERVATSSSAPLLLTGPTGAGKSRLARRIYELKRARNQITGAFVAVNCATIRGDGASSALFGHVKGAFTGAASRRPGLLLAADHGMLFLDEISELGLEEQAMLLGAIEDKRFFPVGTDEATSSDFQLIAGTNQDLRLAVRNGTFREDLLCRINLWSFRLPGLAERRDDIAPNLDYELHRWQQQTGQRVTMNKEARRAFLDFATSAATPWHGSFRDLNAAITRMATLAKGGRINTGLVEEEIARLRDAWGHRPPGDQELITILGAGRAATLDRFDSVQLTEVVAVCRQSRSLSEAGRILFAHSRQKKRQLNDADRLRKYLARFELSWQQVKKPSEAAGQH